MKPVKKIVSAVCILLLAIFALSGPFRTGSPAVPDAGTPSASPAVTDPLNAEKPVDAPGGDTDPPAEKEPSETVSPEPAAQTSGTAEEEALCIAAADAENFGSLLTDLVGMFESRDSDHLQQIEADLDAIRAVSEKDHDVAGSIAAHWLNEFLRDDFPFCIYQGGDTAPELAAFSIPESGHAIVVLGYALADGQMQAELIRRCNAAAAFARTYPDSILVCTGGATGANNPDGNTEAGLMKTYLTEECGLDASRIYIEDTSMDTRENAVNTLQILKENEIRSMTIVTSDYHQRRALELYYAAAQLFRVQTGYTVEITGNFCIPADPETAYARPNARRTILQIAEILELPEEVILSLPQVLPVPGTDE